MAKHSMMSLLPSYNATRMVDEYVKKFYLPASSKGTLFAANDFSGAKNIAAWKTRIKQAWHGVSLRRLDTPYERIHFNEALNFKVAARLNNLTPEDVVVELLICRQYKITRLCNFQHFKFEFTGIQDSGEHLFELKLIPELCGKQEYFIRIYPHHPLLTHPLEMGLMVWL
jgi:starch phosphorylase